MPALFFPGQSAPWKQASSASRTSARAPCSTPSPKGALAANYPFATIGPTWAWSDPRSAPRRHPTHIAPTRSSPPALRLVDIAGIARASKGEGLGNKFLSHIREVDAIQSCAASPAPGGGTSRTSRAPSIPSGHQHHQRRTDPRRPADRRFDLKGRAAKGGDREAIARLGSAQERSSPCSGRQTRHRREVRRPGTAEGLRAWGSSPRKILTSRTSPRTIRTAGARSR